MDPNRQEINQNRPESSKTPDSFNGAARYCPGEHQANLRLGRGDKHRHPSAASTTSRSGLDERLLKDSSSCLLDMEVNNPNFYSNLRADIRPGPLK